MATVAGLLLVGVGVVSARAARRRMRYETWYYLHFYTYLAVALAFSHQFADRRGLHDQPPGPGRLVARCTRRSPPRSSGTGSPTPVRQALRHRLRVVGGVPRGARRRVDRASAAGTWTSCGAEAGQFFRWRFLDPRACGGRPTRTRCRRRRAAGPAADHRQGPRRAQRGAGPAAARHPGRRRGPVRRADRRPAPARARCC